MSAIGQTGSSDLAAQTQTNRTGRTDSAGQSRQTGESGSGAAAGDGFNDLNVNDFLKLMINELQNQDPLDPMTNSEMVQQIGLIREVSATDQLTNTLTNLSNSQELVTASGLIGQSVQGLSDESTEVSGTVDRVTVETDSEKGTRSVKVHVDGKTMQVKNIREIQTG